jgi:TetR/AcrR family transcriptional regulator, transcriptional repressor for nem operon
MGRPNLADAKDTRAELSKVAMEMIQTKGYNAFSYQDLAERLNIRKASIHYHFPTKEDLGVGLLADSAARFGVWKEKALAENHDALSLMKAYFGYFEGIAVHGTRICPMGALTSEWGSLPKRLQEAVSAGIKRHRDWNVMVLNKGREEGVFATKGKVEEQAEFIYASIQGALQAARVQNKAEHFRMVTQQLLDALRK